MTKRTPIIFTLASFSPRNYFETVKKIFGSKNSSKVAESSKSLLNNEEHRNFFSFFFTFPQNVFIFKESDWSKTVA